MVWPLSRVKYRMERGSIPVNLCNWAKRQKHGTSKIASVLAGQTKQLFEIWINLDQYSFRFVEQNIKHELLNM